MKLLVSLLVGAGVLAASAIGAAQPAWADHDRYGRYGDGRYGDPSYRNADRYREYCRDPEYRERYADYCDRYYGRNNRYNRRYGYDYDPYYYGGYYRVFRFGHRRHRGHGGDHHWGDHHSGGHHSGGHHWGDHHWGDHHSGGHHSGGHHSGGHHGGH